MKVLTANKKVDHFTTGVKNTKITTIGIAETEKPVTLSTGYRGRGLKPLQKFIKAGTKVRYSAVENVNAKTIYITIYQYEGGILYTKKAQIKKG